MLQDVAKEAQRLQAEEPLGDALNVVMHQLFQLALNAQQEVTQAVAPGSDPRTHYMSQVAQICDAALTQLMDASNHHALRSLTQRRQEGRLAVVRGPVALRKARD